VQPKPAEKEVATPTFRAKEVLGTKVSISGGTEIGTVEDLVFDDAGNLEYMIVDNGGKLITAPWEAAKFDLAKKTAVLGITQDVYKTIPTYTTTTYPSFYTPTYRTDIYKVYGLTPRQLRVIERRR
jgi:sporulation protein YlmC with PRC-barrel domain